MKSNNTIGSMNIEILKSVMSLDSKNLGCTGTQTSKNLDAFFTKVGPHACFKGINETASYLEKRNKIQ